MCIDSDLLHKQKAQTSSPPGGMSPHVICCSPSPFAKRTIAVHWQPAASTISGSPASGASMMALLQAQTHLYMCTSAHGCRASSQADISIYI